MGCVDLPTIAVWDSPTLSRIVPIHAERRCDLFPEVELWRRHVEQAEMDAEALARGTYLAGETCRPLEASARAERQIRDLRAWCVGTHIGSLVWCAQQISGASGVELDPDRVRARIYKALDRAEARGLKRDRWARIFVRDAA